jgi:hypothetical protein
MRRRILSARSGRGSLSLATCVLTAESQQTKITAVTVYKRFLWATAETATLNASNPSVPRLQKEAEIIMFNGGVTVSLSFATRRGFRSAGNEGLEFL